MADGFVPIFSPAGTGHRAGAVPDPGQETPSTYVLTAAATWEPQSAGTLQEGASGLTIIAAAAATGSTFTFAPAFGAAPVVVCSANDLALKAWADGITEGGFIGHLAADVPVVDDTGATFSYMAM